MAFADIVSEFPIKPARTKSRLRESRTRYPVVYYLHSSELRARWCYRGDRCAKFSAFLRQITGGAAAAIIHNPPSSFKCKMDAAARGESGGCYYLPNIGNSRQFRDINALMGASVESPTDTRFYYLLFRIEWASKFFSVRFYNVKDEVESFFLSRLWIMTRLYVHQRVRFLHHLYVYEWRKRLSLRQKAPCNDIITNCTTRYKYTKCDLYH